jgi:hypothetical protein
MVRFVAAADCNQIDWTRFTVGEGRNAEFDAVVGPTRERRLELSRYLPASIPSAYRVMCPSSQGRCWWSCLMGQEERWGMGWRVKHLRRYRHSLSLGSSGGALSPIPSAPRWSEIRLLSCCFPPLVVAVGLLAQTLESICWRREQVFSLHSIQTNLFYSPPLFLFYAYLLPTCRVSHAREGTSAAKPAAAVRSTARSGSSKWAAPPP